MENLEILDLSKNNLTAFPEKPNKLVNLKVLSLTHNGIITLPIYLTKFESLKVFKVANNPIEWPVSQHLTVSEAVYAIANVTAARGFGSIGRE
jgi:Leucine-rich repeat (LRR) protein